MAHDRLFMRDARWVKKTRNLRVEDVVWMIEDSKLKKKMKWGIVKIIHPDHDGVVRARSGALHLFLYKVLILRDKAVLCAVIGSHVPSGGPAG